MTSARTFIAAVTAVAAVTLTPAVATAAPGDPAPTALAAALAALKGQGYNVSGTIGSATPSGSASPSGPAGPSRSAGPSGSAGPAAPSGSAGPGSPASPSGSAGPSGSAAAGGAVHFDVTGAVDPAAKAAEAEFKGTAGGDPVDINFIQTPTDLYAKFDINSVQSQLGVKPDQWVKVDESKITSPDRLPFDMSGKTDAINLAGMMTSTAGVKYADPTHIVGTVDLTAATGPGAPDPSELQAAGAAAKTTPFVATIDDQGRLTQLTIKADGFDPNLSEDLHLTDYGSPAPVATPPASIPAPASVYPFFNN